MGFKERVMDMTAFSLLDRRRMLGSLVGALALGVSGLAPGAQPLVSPRCRVILDNDFAGDPDGLFQAAHHLLSPSVDVRLIVGSHLHKVESLGSSGEQATNAASKVRQMLLLMPGARRPPVLAGAEQALASATGVAPTAAAQAIIAEAMRGDTDLPLYYCAGAGLTDLATAWLLEPRIGRRLTLVWIGGPEYADLAPPPPGPHEAEYNLTIDLLATQLIFNRSDFEIWQVPRSSYRQMLVSFAALQAQVRTTGPLGVFLVDCLEDVMRKLRAAPPPYDKGLGEAYVLGDSPLVTLTALQSPFQPEASSSRYVLRPRPTVTAAGEYAKSGGHRSIRVYTQIDARLTFEDLYAKLAAAGR